MTNQETSSGSAASIPQGDHDVQRLLKGELQPNRDTSSLIFMTVHKSASSYVADLLARIARSEKIVPIDIETLVYRYTNAAIQPFVSPAFLDCYSRKPTELNEALRTEIEERLPSRGFYFGAVRANSFYHRLPHFGQFRVVLMVRDPRDALTSMYFSVAFSHLAPNGVESARDRFFKRREGVRRMSVDGYVLSVADRFHRTYSDYCHGVLGRPNVLLVKYEDMVRDFRSWLKQIVSFWGLPTNTRTVKTLIKQADFTVSQEDPNSHKRQVQPGDHKRKLKPETIDRLNETYGDVMEMLGYEPKSSAGRDAA